MNYVDLKSLPSPTARKTDKPVKKNLPARFAVLVIFGILVLGLVNAGKIKEGLAQAFNPINLVTTITGNSGGKLKEDDGRTNILVLGTDQRSSSEYIYAGLTDTIMVISVSKNTRDAVLISIPRDMWVESSNEARYKINELYGIYGGKNGTGTKEILDAVQSTLGIPIHYYGVVNFTMFREVIDTLGGIDVDVEIAFVDKEYPIEGKEDAILESERYETVSFSKGMIKMDGATALKFARSRHGNNDEGTDFARARRQQKLIMAVKSKALSTETLLDFAKIKSLYELYSKNVDTNMDASTLQLAYTLAQSARFDSIRTLVLDDRSEGENGGLLYAPTDLTLYGGRYVLIPKAGDYSQIHAYIQKYLFN